MNDEICNLVIGATVAQEIAHIELIGRKEARAELAVTRETHTVTVSAERLRHTRNHTNSALTVEIAPSVCWSSATCRNNFQREL